MLGKLFIKNLIVRTCIGIYPKEKAFKQDIVINITMYIDMTKAAKTDQMEDSVSYGDIYRKIVKLTDTTSFNLMESLAGYLVNLCLQEEKVEKVEVTIEKPHSEPSLESAGVTLTKTKNSELSTNNY